MSPSSPAPRVSQLSLLIQQKNQPGKHSALCRACEGKEGRSEPTPGAAVGPSASPAVESCTSLGEGCEGRATLLHKRTTCQRAFCFLFVRLVLSPSRKTTSLLEQGSVPFLPVLPTSCLPDTATATSVPGDFMTSPLLRNGGNFFLQASAALCSLGVPLPASYL